MFTCFSDNLIVHDAGNGTILDENGDYKMMTMMNNSVNSAGHVLMPSGRGGHQMLWDSGSRRILLLGGWDGKRDLADFWSFDPNSRTWTLISGDVEKEGGPGARSCHKAALHTAARHIYVLGRYIDPERRDPLNLPCDFYRFDLQTGKWSRLSSDVRTEGGPGCIYDHQMVVDEEEECIWVFGGRLLSGTNEHSVYSGLYRYDLRSGQWTFIQSDTTTTANINDNVNVNVNVNNNPNSHTPALPPVRVPSRIGHSMLFDPLTRSLLILFGQRYKDQLTDFYRYTVDRAAVSHLCKNLQMVGGPEAGYTQRAVIDVERREMFLFSSMMRTDAGATENELNSAAASTTAQDSNCFWSFDLDTDRWTRIRTNPSSPVPPSRFAHQIVYDPATQSIFLFGGNPGNPVDPTARLSDFWSARLVKVQGSSDILRRCRFLIRRAVFESLLQDTPAALQFLQRDLAEVVNHSDPSESILFRSLSAKLFSRSASSEARDNRDLFNEIVKFLPKSLQPPINNL